MALPQHITYQKGGRISVDLMDLPLAATVSVVAGNGTTKIPHSNATLSGVNTVLSQSLNVGNYVMNVGDNASISYGVPLVIGPVTESVDVRDVSGDLVHLRNPVVKDHQAGSSVVGARVTYDVSALEADDIFFDGRAEWNLAWSNGDTSTVFTAVECGKYPNHRLATIQDILDCEPNFALIVEREADPERLLDGAHMTVLEEIAKASPDGRARTFTGSMAFRRATAAAALFHYYQPRSSEEKMETWWNEFQRRLIALVAVVPRDADQDGVVAADEKFSMGSVRLRR